MTRNSTYKLPSVCHASDVETPTATSHVSRHGDLLWKGKSRLSNLFKCLKPLVDKKTFAAQEPVAARFDFAPSQKASTALPCMNLSRALTIYDPSIASEIYILQHAFLEGSSNPIRNNTKSAVNHSHSPSYLELEQCQCCLQGET